MVQVKCINKIRDKRGIIQYYTLIDKQGNQKTVTADALKNVIRNRQLECINLTLTSDNRLIDRSDRTIQKPVQTQVSKSLTPVEMYKEYLNTPYMKKVRTLGIRPEAEYKVDDEDVILTKVNITNGEFIIPPFVTRLDVERNSGYNEYVKSAFKDCIKIKVINKSMITNMSFMFLGCSRLEELDLSEFDTSKVTNMAEMFNECGQLKKLNLSGFDTSKVKSMDNMFAGCSNLEKLDLSNFNTSQVRCMFSMFYCCSKLKDLDINNFNTDSINDTTSMFEHCKYKNTFKVPKSLMEELNTDYDC